MKLDSEELDDVGGAKPQPLDEESAIKILKGHKFKFSLDGYLEYMVDSRRIGEQILKRTVVDIDRAVQTLEAHLNEVQEPQYRSLILMRLFQVAIEQVKPKEVAVIVKYLFQLGLVTKQQIRRGLVRLFWRLEDILLDHP